MTIGASAASFVVRMGRDLMDALGVRDNMYELAKYVIGAVTNAAGRVTAAAADIAAALTGKTVYLASATVPQQNAFISAQTTTGLDAVSVNSGLIPQAVSADEVGARLGAARSVRLSSPVIRLPIILPAASNRGHSRNPADEFIYYHYENKQGSRVDKAVRTAGSGDYLSCKYDYYGSTVNVKIEKRYVNNDWTDIAETRTYNNDPANTLASRILANVDAEASTTIITTPPFYRSEDRPRRSGVQLFVL